MANHITSLRRKAGYKTAKDAAIELKISYGMMYQMEEDLKRPSPDLALNMARLFDCSLEDIFMPFSTTNSDNVQKEPAEGRYIGAERAR